MRPLVALLAFALPALAAPVPKALKKPPPNPDGVWYLVEAGTDGEATPVESVVREWAVSGEEMLMGAKSLTDRGPSVHVSPFSIYDPSRPHLRKSGGFLYAFEVDGDTLRWCYAYDQRKELTEYQPQKGVHHYVLQRVTTTK